MSRKYGVGTGLPVAPQTENEDLQRLLIPLHTGINGLAQSLSDLSSKTQLTAADLQGLSAETLIVERAATGMEVIVYNLAETNSGYGKFVRLIQSVLTPGVSTLGFELASSPFTTNSAYNVWFRTAQGYISEPDGIPVGTYGRVMLGSGLLRFAPGALVVGSPYFLGPTGTVTNLDAAFAANCMIQPVGIALTDQILAVNLHQGAASIRSHWAQPAI